MKSVRLFQNSCTGPSAALRVCHDAAAVRIISARSTIYTNWFIGRRRLHFHKHSKQQSIKRQKNVLITETPTRKLSCCFRRNMANALLLKIVRFDRVVVLFLFCLFLWHSNFLFYFFSERVGNHSQIATRDTKRMHAKCEVADSWSSTCDWFTSGPLRLTNLNASDLQNFNQDKTLQNQERWVFYADKKRTKNNLKKVCTVLV